MLWGYREGSRCDGLRAAAAGCEGSDPRSATAARCRSPSRFRRRCPHSSAASPHGQATPPHSAAPPRHIGHAPSMQDHAPSHAAPARFAPLGGNAGSDAAPVSRQPSPR
ncbi:unnamed protein product [Coccothraustes coccothraustes]